MRKHHDQGKSEEETALFGLVSRRRKVVAAGKGEAWRLEQKAKSSHLPKGSIKQRKKMEMPLHSKSLPLVTYFLCQIHIS